VLALARRYQTVRCPVADLVQEGNIGLLRALEMFDPRRGARLSSYARWWIRAAMLRFLEHNHRLVRGATTSERTRLFYQLAHTRSRRLCLGKDASREALARAMGVTTDDVGAMELLASAEASLGTSGELARRGDVRDASSDHLDGIADDAPSPEEWLAHEELRARVKRTLDTFGRTLRGRARELFRERVASTNPASRSELQARWGVGNATLRHDEERIAAPLRRFLYREMGDSVVAWLGGA
jgi:RNA polymerase sigma-32 factor